MLHLLENHFLSNLWLDWKAVTIVIILQIKVTSSLVFGIPPRLCLYHGAFHHKEKDSLLDAKAAKQTVLLGRMGDVELKERCG